MFFPFYHLHYFPPFAVIKELQGNKGKSGCMHVICVAGRYPRAVRPPGRLAIPVGRFYGVRGFGGILPARAVFIPFPYPGADVRLAFFLVVWTFFSCGVKQCIR